MNWEIISNLFVIIGLLVVWVLDWRANREIHKRLDTLEQEFNDTLQIIKDKVDVDGEVNEARYAGFHQNLATVDLKLSALGRAAGFVLENGLWQKQKPVAVKATKPSGKRGATAGAKKV